MKLTLGTDRDARKNTPLLGGCINYFLAALAGVARHSFRSNKIHNAGEPMHWARGKSMDHGECIIRHCADIEDIKAFMARNNLEGEPEQEVIRLLLEEADARAWRALADSQELYEKYGGAPMSPASRLPPPPVEPPVVLIPDAPVDAVIQEIIDATVPTPAAELDPVGRHGDGKWYFWDDGWMLQSGPYDSEMEARAAYGEYRRVTDAG